MASITSQRDVRVFNFKTSKKDLLIIVTQANPHLKTNEINNVVTKIVTVCHAINFLKKRYKKEDLTQKVALDSSCQNHYPEAILMLAIYTISSLNMSKETSLNEIVSDLVDDIQKNLL